MSDKEPDKTITDVKPEETAEERTTFDTLSQIHNINDAISIPITEEDTKFEIISSATHQFDDQLTFTKDVTSQSEKPENTIHTESLNIPFSTSQMNNAPFEFNPDELFSESFGEKKEPKKEKEMESTSLPFESLEPLEPQESTKLLSPLEPTTPISNFESLPIEPLESESAFHSNDEEFNYKEDEDINIPSIHDELPKLELEALKPTDDEDLSRSLMQQEEMNASDFFQDMGEMDTQKPTSTKKNKNKSATEVFKNIQKAAEQPTHSPVFKEALYPFTLCIEGELEPYEKEKLLDILSKFNLGIRELDLQPQFDSHKILLPRLSEYACIFIAQNFRDAKVLFKMGPSDQIFSTVDTKNDPLFLTSQKSSKTQTYSSESLQGANQISIFQGSQHPEGKKIQILGSLSVSHTIHSPHESQIKRSDDYAEKLESLTKELQHKAYYKGADMILNFTVSLQSLKTPGLYKMLLLGVAVKTL